MSMSILAIVGFIYILPCLKKKSKCNIFNKMERIAGG